MGVHAAITDQAEQMQIFIFLFGFSQSLQQYRIFAKDPSRMATLIRWSS